ncbi:MAG: dolichol-p-glucose synthetase, (glycosyltransferase) [Candidatus Fermentimicrarchaeum limneticum]|uniref:Dolichol-p-glucose synthetase, (Glycosyltransferase) n=1 Tax=Fermentimicrarchaeum limneticum TaxID=2795018 RepID=A0A7D6BUC5_FERL1|nr:MAG: dolichol-p-glucose synthetase, (glycosyltransferase) [Candidatus Fermentimicrarchaeum limneticum]
MVLRNKVEVSVIIPAKNEEATIADCISKIAEIFRRESIKGEIIVADSSTDKTPEIARRMGAKVVKSPSEGYGSAYMTGFEAAKGEYIIMGDADDTYDFHEIPRFIKLLRENKADLVLGSRVKGSILPDSMPWLHRYVGNPLLSFTLNTFFGANISDAHTGFRAIRRDAFEKLDLHTTGMEFASEMIVKSVRKKLRIVEVPITYYPRKARSKLSSFSDGWRHLRFMLLYSPNYLFIIPGSIMFLLGMILMFALLKGPVTILDFKLDLHPMVLASLAAIVGFQMLVMGFFTKTYAAVSHLEEETRSVRFLYEHFSLEKASLLGIAMIILGVILSFDIIYSWVMSNFGQLFEVRRAIFSSTLIILGIQVIFSAFFLSILVLPKKE